VLVVVIIESTASLEGDFTLQLLRHKYKGIFRAVSQMGGRNRLMKKKKRKITHLSS